MESSRHFELFFQTQQNSYSAVSSECNMNIMFSGRRAHNVTVTHAFFDLITIRIIDEND